MIRGKTMGLAAVAAMAMAPLAGCENLPGTREQQATAIGGVIGGLAGSQLNESNPLMGALLGGAIGAGGGYLIGARTDWFEDPEESRDEARRSIEVAQERPATVEDARRASTADLNGDGFVTVDELVAMQRAGLSDQKIIGRLQASNQIFDLSAAQERALRQEGISDRVIREMRSINREQRDDILGRRR